MLDSLKTPLVVLGRILIALMFVLSGIDKLTNIQATAGYLPSGGLPASSFLVVLTGLFEVLTGLAIATGFLARWAALAVAAFTLVASVLFHAYWSAPADQQMVTQLLFMKNIAIVGGLLVLAALGPGPASLGRRQSS